MSMLSRWSVVWRAVGAASCRRVAVQRPVTATPWRRFSSSKEVTNIDADDFDQRWVDYFSNKEIDDWELRQGLNKLYGMDLVPEPKIVVAMIEAARRLNDIAMAIRILEAVKEKAAGNKEIYSYIIKEIKPTLDELGLNTPEELGLA
ncbi:PREDICTED: cytochrome c oxidase subunit 5A, mitochondrial-like [Amphimedon queenslandica]|uniref:Cytochrome c oxidase subunit 5A, mitochondrial n=1 Tax=Amphimedon queenslandica TaxID=400682 RepID=A0A1X7USS8_AMPQE|nr:PREDICTED: cytochrome c oxidase subunit 5A, mitochondrial-like [Amphimedon queenslandica]XP_011404160.1 PREDICTED: cytochrome c oxidase subunit 5A, mitochondrial-like [Amphimedon queenslandica]|eukprot:XP_003386898.1 PREDICTED: cytochrome c oxidase subunit 5A, mitochondrial-like [Amphimedon queenslandica]